MDASIMRNRGLTLETFNSALMDGLIAISVCATCRTQQAIPSASCFHCGGTDLEVRRHNGAGVIFSWVVCHYAFEPAWQSEVPYIVVLVNIEGGGRVYGRLSKSIASAITLRAGLPVELDGSATSLQHHLVYVLKGKTE
jgi:uncharacterized OB-fold protein